MSRRMNILVGILMLCVLFGVLSGGYKYGLKQCKPCPQPMVQKEAKKPVEKPKIAKKQVMKQAPAPVRQQVAVPNYGATRLILRIVVVEWSPIFQGKSLKSRDIGPIVNQGLANGTVVRTKEVLGFLVNGASVIVRDGSAIVDPGPIGPETVLVIQPANGAKFASPPNGLPLITSPEELDDAVKKGVSGVRMNFILAPAARPAPIRSPKGGSRPFLCFYRNDRGKGEGIRKWKIL